MSKTTLITPASGISRRTLLKGAAGTAAASSVLSAPFVARAFPLPSGSTVDLDLLKWSLREELNRTADRVMVVLRPLKVVIENYPEDQTEEFEFPNHPDYPEMGTRKVPFGRELYIERSDFMEDAPRKFFRLSVGREVRLRFAYYVTCTDFVKDDEGNVIEVICTYDPDAGGSEVAGDGQRHADHSTFGGTVGGLADLALHRGDRRRRGRGRRRRDPDIRRRSTTGLVRCQTNVMPRKVRSARSSK